MNHYLKSTMCILELLRDGNMTISIHTIYLDDELAKKYGVQTATINLWIKDADMQWTIWHEHRDQ